MDKKQLIDTTLGRGIDAGRETLHHCPFCGHHKPKLSVNIEKNVWKCWVCNTRGNDIYHLLVRVSTEAARKWQEITGEIVADRTLEDVRRAVISGDTSLFRAPEVPTVDIAEFWPASDFQPLALDRSRKARRARKYMLRRGFHDYDFLRWQVGYCARGDYRDRIIIPSFGADSKINYFVARDFTNTQRRYDNPPIPKEKIIFNEFFIDWKREVILVEGVMDAMKVHRGNAIPLLGSALPENSLLFQRLVQYKTPVRVILDPDAWKKQKRIVEMLTSAGIPATSQRITRWEDLGAAPPAELEVTLARLENAASSSLDIIRQEIQERC